MKFPGVLIPRKAEPKESKRGTKHQYLRASLSGDLDVFPTFAFIAQIGTKGRTKGSPLRFSPIPLTS